MEQINFINHTIFYDSHTIEEKEELKKIINNKIYEDILWQIKEDTILVLWWDWTMLKAIKKYYDENKQFLWINFWRKWFLLNPKEYIKKWFSYVTRTYPLLEIETNLNWNTKKEIAVNEIDIRAGEWKMISLSICLSEKQNINIEWDWLIISTPAWSTWYNSSLGWPVIPHTINAFVLTPKASWRPKRQGPIIINDSEIIKIKNTWRKNQVEIYCDWELFIKTDKEQSLNIRTKKSKKEIKLIISEQYLNIWDNKVLQEQWFQI